MVEAARRVTILVAVGAMLGLAVPAAADTTRRGTFEDDDGTTHEATIEAIAAVGITRGCDPDGIRYCPDDPVTRGEMAAFLRRAFDLPAADVDQFIDDDGSTFEADIDALAAAGITRGCNPPENTRYCPDQTVTRGQMAAFLRRALEGTLTPGPAVEFIDDDGSVFEADIEWLGATGVTRGCNPPDNTRFCPDEEVGRDQMASFLARALGLQPKPPGDRPDDIDGRQLHVMYVVPADGVDRRLDVDGTIANGVKAMQRWLAEQTGGRRFRLDTFDGEPDISFFRLSRPEADLEPDLGTALRIIVEELRDAGRLEPTKVYGVYYDGTNAESCGAAQWSRTATGQVAAIYLRAHPPGAAACDSEPFAGPGDDAGYLELAMLHDLFHVLGAVPPCAPNYDHPGHVAGSNRDLMWNSEGFWDVNNLQLDIGRDDYYGHGRSECPDVADDPILTAPASSR